MAYHICPTCESDLQQEGSRWWCSLCRKYWSKYALKRRGC